MSNNIKHEHYGKFHHVIFRTATCEACGGRMEKWEYEGGTVTACTQCAHTYTLPRKPRGHQAIKEKKSW